MRLESSPRSLRRTACRAALAFLLTCAPAVFAAPTELFFS